MRVSARKRSDGIVTKAPGGHSPGVFRCAVQTCGSASSSTRAKQAIRTLVAPARRSARTQVSLVAPLVITSSTSSTCAPRNRTCHAVLTAIVPRSALARSVRPSPPSDGVARVRISASTASVRPGAAAIVRASSADWLKPRRHNRQRCNGTGTTSHSPVRSPTRAAISRPSSAPRATRRPCLKASTRSREVGL